MGAYTGSSSGSSTGSNLLYAASGAAGGVTVYDFMAKQKKALNRANWALGIGVAVVALAAFSSSDLNSDQTTWQSLAARAAGLSFTTGGGVTGEEVSGLRAVVIDVCNAGAKTSYDANLFSFNGAPVPQPAPVQISTITPVAVGATSSTNNNAIIAVILVLALLAIVFMS